MERWLCDNTVLYSNQCTADETFQTRDVPLRAIQTKVVLSKKVGIRKKFDLHI
ncbi:hypothetical protein T03_15991 [Trichinella britovi]|uniref:Uncharacterized protein n=1 Tax=Trichinella britovi TaxID=45882 RepID=A0A0V1AX58_TRIBR|nr:hypothetical protein T03_15991 [Trichinella britovi]